ncbi:hypothetical protein GGR56DRAFT_692494 [Xylariaceae sp. FL0804]|nr:hypothetical protein GGR56DRAFT_692494 [Xylariaceae sp. FL0804]
MPFDNSGLSHGHCWLLSCRPPPPGYHHCSVCHESHAVAAFCPSMDDPRDREGAGGRARARARICFAYRSISAPPAPPAPARRFRLFNERQQQQHDEQHEPEQQQEDPVYPPPAEYPSLSPPSPPTFPPIFLLPESEQAQHHQQQQQLSQPLRRHSLTTATIDDDSQRPAGGSSPAWASWRSDARRRHLDHRPFEPELPPPTGTGQPLLLTRLGDDGDWLYSWRVRERWLNRLAAVRRRFPLAVAAFEAARRDAAARWHGGGGRREQVLRMEAPAQRRGVREAALAQYARERGWRDDEFEASQRWFWRNVLLTRFLISTLGQTIAEAGIMQYSAADDDDDALDLRAANPAAVRSGEECMCTLRGVPRGPCMLCVGVNEWLEDFFPWVPTRSEPPESPTSITSSETSSSDESDDDDDGPDPGQGGAVNGGGDAPADDDDSDSDDSLPGLASVSDNTHGDAGDGDAPAEDDDDSSDDSMPPLASVSDSTHGNSEHSGSNAVNDNVDRTGIVNGINALGRAHAHNGDDDCNCDICANGFLNSVSRQGAQLRLMEQTNGDGVYTGTVLVSASGIYRLHSAHSDSNAVNGVDGTVSDGHGGNGHANGHANGPGNGNGSDSHHADVSGSHTNGHTNGHADDDDEDLYADIYD